MDTVTAAIPEEKASACGMGAYPLIVAAVVSVILAILLFSIVAIGIQGYFAYLDRADSSTFSGYLYQDNFFPENVERLQYIAALVVIPSIITGGCLALAGPLKRRPRLARSLCYGALALCLIGVPLLAYADVSADSFYFTESALFRTAGVLSVIVVAPVIPAIYLFEKYGGRIKSMTGRWSGLAFWAGAMAMILPVAFMFVTDKYGIQDRLQGGHLSAIMYPVVQVHGGQAMLVDTISQYGLYAQFLQPIFFLIGLDTFRFFLVMSAIACLAFVCQAAFLYGNVRNRFIALTGLAAVIYCSYLFIRLIMVDPYFQYVPVRLIFPSLLLLAGWLYFKSRKRWLYYGNFLMAAVALLWNMDSGIVVAGAWLAALAYDEWTMAGPAVAARKFAVHLLRCAGIFIAVLAAFTLYVFLVRGAVPDYGMMLRYQSIYYGLGYLMMPMTWLHPWNLVGLAYVAGIAYAVVAKISGKADTRARMIFMLSIVGAGIFSYYQGRSHDYNLSQVTYPAIMITVIFVDMLYSRFLARPREPGNPDRAIAIAGTCACVAGILLLTAAMLCVILSSGQIAGEIGAGLGAMQERPDSEMLAMLTYIQDNTKPGDQVYIISHDQGFYYAESGTSNPLKVPSQEEILSQADIDKICSYLSQKGDRATVFADFSDNVNADVIQAITDYYVFAGRSPGGKMYMFVPRVTG